MTAAAKRGTQRMIRESTRNPNNPFYQTRNPLPVGFGLGGVSELTDARSEGTRSGWIQEPEPVRTPRIARHPEGARERPVVQCGVTPRSGNIVRELVAMEVDEVIARRAAQNTAGRRTVAAAMKWILDNEPGAVGDLEKRWRARSALPTQGSGCERIEGIHQNHCQTRQTHSSQLRTVAAERFLKGEKVGRGRGRGLGRDGTVAGGAPGGRERELNGTLTRRRLGFLGARGGGRTRGGVRDGVGRGPGSDVGSIHVNLPADSPGFDGASDAGSIHAWMSSSRGGTPSSNVSSRPRITVCLP
jgi:hypothetical protein